MYELIRVAEAPELDEEAGRRFVEDWPEFIFHDAEVKVYADRRLEFFRDWEFYLVDPGRRLIAGCWGVPIAWDGTVEDLPGGYTDSLARAVTSYEEGVVPNTFVVMAAAVRSDEQGRGHAGRVISAVLADDDRDRRRMGEVDRHGLPRIGPYVIPDGLALLHIDRPADTGTYREPNIWMPHT